MKIKITKRDLLYTEHHLQVKVNLDGNNYFFGVKVWRGGSTDANIITISRGNDYSDCGRRLKTKEKKLIKKTIERMFK